ncbi:MAG: DUF4912 domain-containing protein [Planctomycetota bacterium]|jgi:hypothetical protein|nr:DUF4912 domain-containing protein [Planctomycetota bacterium]
MVAHYSQVESYALTAVAQSPQVLWVGWDAAQLAGAGGGRWALNGWCLRVVALGGETRDYAIQPEWGKFYVTGLRGGESYCARLLLQNAVHEWHALAASDWLQMPANTLAPAGEESDAEFLALFGDDVIGIGASR